MSHRVNIEDAKKKLDHENEVNTLIKKGEYHSDRFEKRRLKRLLHEVSWFQYIKGRGGIKEPEKKEVKNATTKNTSKEETLEMEQRTEVQ